MVPSCFEAFILDADLGSCFLFECIESDMAKYGEILGTIAFADAAVIFAEGDVENPVQRVLNLPVRPSGVKGLCGVSGCTADEVAVFK